MKEFKEMNFLELAKLTESRHMAKTVSIEENLPHTVSEVICINCKHRWLALRPTATWLKDLQCPKCKQKGYVIEAGQIIDDEE